MRTFTFLLGSACLILLPVVADAQEPTIDLQWDVRIPEHVENPGGEFNAICTVEPGSSTPFELIATLTDPAGFIIFTEIIPEATEFDYHFQVPDGSLDGLYKYHVRYIFDGEGGPSISAEGEILVAGGVTGLCVIKFFDADGDGEYDDEEVLSGWEMCYDGPSGTDCEVTGDAGTACWFGIEPGTYTVCETLQEGYACTTCDDCCCMTAEVVADDITKILIGNGDEPIPVIQSSWGEIKHIHR